MAPVETAAVLLRFHDYGDTSRVLRFYSARFGLVSVVAKGVRGQSGKGATSLSSYASGALTAYIRPGRDLHTMKDFHCHALREALGTDLLRFAGASLVAELVLAHADQEPHAELFEALESGLDLLADAPRGRVANAALSGAWRIVDAFGFAPQLDPCVRCGRELGPDEVGRVDFAAGGVRCAACGQDAAGPRMGPIARGQVAGLLAGEIDAELTHARRHLAVLSDFVAYHVVSRPLKSLDFLGRMLPPDEGTAS